MRSLLPLPLAIFILFFITAEVSGQYFGRNKPKYDKFEFDVVKTPHFDIYHYFNNPALLYQLSEMSESWYQMHQQVVMNSMENLASIFCPAGSFKVRKFTFIQDYISLLFS